LRTPIQSLSVRAVALLTLALLAILPPLASRPASAQAPSAGPAPVPVPPAVQVPGFWDPRRRPERPDLSRITVIRFLTETDYPPFNFAGPDGNPQGFNVDLARMMCDALKVGCIVHMRPLEKLRAALYGD